MGPTISSNNHPSCDAVDLSERLVLPSSISPAAAASSFRFLRSRSNLPWGAEPWRSWCTRRTTISRAKRKCSKRWRQRSKKQREQWSWRIREQRSAVAPHRLPRAGRNRSTGRKYKHWSPPPCLSTPLFATELTTADEEASHQDTKMAATSLESPAPNNSGLETASSSPEHTGVTEHSQESIATAATQLCRLLGEVCASLAPQVQSFPGAKPGNPLPPGLEALASVILTACQGMDASLQHLYPPPTLVKMPAVSTSTRRAAVASRQLAPGRVAGSPGPHNPRQPVATTGTSWALVVSGKAKRNGHRTVTSTTDSSHNWTPSDSHGAQQPNGSLDAHGPDSPAQTSTLLGRAKATTIRPQSVPVVTSNAGPLRRHQANNSAGGCGRCSRLSGSQPSPPPAEAIEVLLFAKAPTEPVVMETEGSTALSAQSTKDEPE